jgi:hypothetical protein
MFLPNSKQRLSYRTYVEYRLIKALHRITHLLHVMHRTPTLNKLISWNCALSIESEMRLQWREHFPVLKYTLLSKWLEIKVRKFQPCPNSMNLLRISGHLHMIFLGMSQLRGSSVNKFTSPNVLRS